METRIVSYPAVLYDDEVCFCLVIKDLNIVIEGDTVEEAFTEASRAIEMYCDMAAQLEAEVYPPTSYIDMCKQYLKNKVLLVYAKVKVKKVG